MAKLPPKQEEGNSQEWLNTYADMVTLLLTFFVLLFACSNLDETKLQYVFQEFKAHGRYVNSVLTNQDPYAIVDGAGVTDKTDEAGGEGSMPQSFEELYQYLADYVERNNLSDSVSVEQGEAHIKIRFNSSVMFDGDSSILNDAGRELLDGFIPGIRAVSKFIARDTVSGHTSVGSSHLNDWSLSANRAVSVTNYLINNKTLEESKFRVMGCGPYEPVSENQPENRRVEMLLLKNELDITDMNVIRDILEHDYNLGSNVFDNESQKPGNTNNLPAGSVDKIIGFINDKFNGSGSAPADRYGPTDVDGSKFVQSETSGSTSS